MHRWCAGFRALGRSCRLVLRGAALCCCCLVPTVFPAAGCHVCRERGARALEERLEMKKVADAPLPPTAAVAEAAGSLPLVGP